MSSGEKIAVSPLGFVRRRVEGGDVKDRKNIAELVFHKDLGEALEGIKDFSHLFVIFWLHEISNEERGKMKVHPRGRKDLPLLGIFATRSAYRPNPIGLTLVKILEVRDNVVTVRGLDAVNGTPILDIKPYDYWDKVEDVYVPEWWIALEKDIRAK